MPVIKSAAKKLRQDKKREAQNNRVREILKTLVKKAKKQKTAKSVIDATSAVDKAAKLHIIHKNKAAHIKSSLSHLLVRKETATAKKVTKTTAKKTPKKSSK